MRLIDADKLIEICRKGWKLFGRENEKLKHWVDEYDINAQPTVDAIPVEWLKYHVMGRSDLTFDKLELIWSTIKAWEKENGAK